MPSAALIVHEDAAVRLRIAIARLSRRLRPTAAGSAAGLTPTRVSVLVTVVREEQIRISALAAAEGLNPTMLSRAISRLSDEGLIERISDDGDRRSAWVKSTPAGRRLAERMRRERTDALSQALNGMSASDRRIMEQALPALERLAERLPDRRL